jgi:AcrR family transcriptional regulator
MPESMDDLAEDRHRAGPKGEQTRARIKRAALRLFALKGLDDVSIREILRASGQRNAGSINYYFSSRAELVAELIRDVAQILDAHHLERIEALEARGGPTTMREVAEILVSFTLPEGGDDESAAYAARFMNMALINHREMVFDALRDGQDRGTRRCLAHLRRLAPELPGALMQERLTLTMVYLISAASAREAARADEDAWRQRWGRESFRQNIADTVVGMLSQPASPETLAALAEDLRAEVAEDVAEG